MNITAIFNFLLIAGAVQGFVFNIATFLARKKAEPQVLYLNLFVLFLSLNNLQSWFLDIGFYPEGSLYYYFIVPWYVLIVPMFYAFLIFYLGIEKMKWPFIRITLGLFMFEVLLRAALLYLVTAKNLPTSIMAEYNALEDAVTLSYSLFLYIKSIRILYAHADLYRHILSFDDLSWIKRFLQLGGVVLLLWLIAVLLNLFSDLIEPPYSYYPLRLGSSILIYWVGYQAFFHYVILKDRIALRARIGSTGKDPELKGSLSAGPSHNVVKDEDGFREIDQYILTHQKYLDPQLSLERLAEELATGLSTLSRRINLHSGKNFSDYINELRVEEAKKLLGDKQFNSYTIVAIGLECGFNSKSTFYSSFKKFTGLTPTEYKERYCKE